jgi:hypothetical protein
VTTLAFPTDAHYPFQDENARQVALKIVAEFKPEEIITGSDGLDFYSLSHFDKDPAVLKGAGLQRQIDLWVGGEKEWTSAAPLAKKRWIPGNHEVRFEKYLWRNPELCDLDVLKISSVLKFDVCGIKEEPEEEINYFDLLSVRHGTVVKKHSAATALGEMEIEKYAISTMSGHTHRGGTAYVTVRGKLRQAQECFCLCSLEPLYMRSPNWQQGIVLATVTKKYLSIEPIPFTRIAGKVVAHWRGKEFRQ